MKNTILLILTILAVQGSSFAQINGNGNKITETFPLENLYKLEINLTADIIIDLQAPSGITITTDENVMDYINVKMKKGYLDLTQLDWIEPNGYPKVVIGAPNLERVICDAHSNVQIKNLDQNRFKLKANVGTIQMEGKVDYLDLVVKVADVNTEALQVNTADVKIKSWGKVKLGEVQILRSDIDNSGQLIAEKKPASMSGDAVESIAKAEKPLDESIRFFDFKLKNNSLRRLQFYVVGPKADGSRFSYGFPMNPGQVREKYWSNGSKVYKVSKLGMRKLVLTIKENDEGQLVKIFEN